MALLSLLREQCLREKRIFGGLFWFLFFEGSWDKKARVFFSVSWDPGGPNVYFSRVFVRDSEAVF